MAVCQSYLNCQKFLELVSAVITSVQRQFVSKDYMADVAVLSFPIIFLPSCVSFKGMPHPTNKQVQSV